MRDAIKDYVNCKTLNGNWVMSEEHNEGKETVLIMIFSITIKYSYNISKFLLRHVVLHIVVPYFQTLR